MMIIDDCFEVIVIVVELLWLIGDSPSGRVGEVVQGHGGPPLKSLDLDGNFKPEHMLFWCEFRFVAIYALFGDLWAKKSAFFG